MIDEAVRPAALRQVTLQRGEVRKAFVGRDNHLAVEDDAMCHQLAGGRDDVAEAVGPVVTAAGKHAGARVALVQLGAIAVELDFVNPVVAGGRLGMQRRERRFDEAGKRAAANPFQLLGDLEGRGLQRILTPRFRNGTLHTLTNT
jgi:hypothetical protein